MRIVIDENASISVGEAKERLTTRSVDVAISLAHATHSPWKDQQVDTRVDPVTLFNNSFLELVFLSDAQAQLKQNDDEQLEFSWVSEASRAIRKAAKIEPLADRMERARLYTNQKLRADSYYDMRTLVRFENGDELSEYDRVGKPYAVQVALEKIVFIPLRK